MRHRALRSESYRRQESQLSHFQLLLGHVDIQCGIDQVGVVAQGLLNDCLKLRVGEHAAPGQVAEAGGVGLVKHRIVEQWVAHNAVGLHLRPLVFVVERMVCLAAAQQNSCKTYDYYVFTLFHGLIVTGVTPQFYIPLQVRGHIEPAHSLHRYWYCPRIPSE